MKLFDFFHVWADLFIRNNSNKEKGSSNIMVKELTRNKRKLFACEECGLLYEKEEWAIKCENWDEENEICNPKIIKNSIKVK